MLGLTGSHLDQPQVSDHQQQQDSPNQVMDVEAAGGHILKRPDADMNRERHCPHARKGEQKRERGPEESLSALALEMETVKPGAHCCHPARELFRPWLP